MQEAALKAREREREKERERERKREREREKKKEREGERGDRQKKENENSEKTKGKTTPPRTNQTTNQNDNHTNLQSENRTPNATTKEYRSHKRNLKTSPYKSVTSINKKGSSTNRKQERKGRQGQETRTRAEKRRCKTRQTHRMHARANPSVDERGKHTYNHASCTTRAATCANARGVESARRRRPERNLVLSPKNSRTQPQKCTLLRSDMTRSFSEPTSQEAFIDTGRIQAERLTRSCQDIAYESYPEGRAFKKPPAPAETKYRVR